MTALPVLASLLVPLLPGLAAVLWVRAHFRARGVAAPDFLAGLAVAYTGIGLAAIALWIAATIAGMSAATSVGATLAVTLVIAGAAVVQRTRATAVADGRAGRAAVPARLVQAPQTPPRHRQAVLACALASAVLFAIPFAPYGWTRADGVHRMALTDWEKHIVMATAIAGAPAFPPPHPYVRAHSAPSYYFGYHLVGAAMTSVGSRSGDVFPPLWLLALLTAAATPVVVYVVARDLVGATAALVAAASGSLLVGFDLVVLGIDALRAAVAAWPLPPGFAGLRAIIPSTHLDYWLHNLDRSFSAPVVSTMWAPHQTAATLVALVTMHLQAPRADEDPAVARAGALLPGLLIASLAALSTYVAMSLAVGIAACVLVEAWATRRPPWQCAVLRRWMPAGLIGLVLALPVLPTVVRGSSSGLIVALSNAGTWSNGAVFTWLFGPAQWTWLLDTPAVFAVDFGLIGAAAAVCLVRHWRGLNRPQTDAAVAALAVLVLVTFVRPPVGVGNNLYARGLLLSWFLLAPFAAVTVLEFRRSRLLAVAVAVSAAGTLYAEVGYLLEGSVFWATPTATVDTLRWVNAHTPPTAVVAIRPSEFENVYGYWLRRPIVLGGQRLALLFGADADAYAQARAALESAYQGDSDARAWNQFADTGASTVLVRRGTAPTWIASPCFPVVYENTDWLVVSPSRLGCPPHTSSDDAHRD